MNRFFEKFWVGWSLIALLGLLLMGSVAAGQGDDNPRSNWLAIGPQELQRDNVGSIFAGPILEPGPHMVWVAAKQNNTKAPFTVWRSYGPFDVVAGQNYLVTVRGTATPIVNWRERITRLNDDPSLASAALVHYLNLTEGEQIFGITVAPAFPGVADMVITDTLAVTDPKEPRQQAPHRAHEVFLDQGKTYIVEMRSNAFDAFMMIEDGRGELLAQTDEDSMVLGNRAVGSHIVFQPPTSGTYRLCALAYASWGEGAYSITVREVPVMMRVEDLLTTFDEARNDSFYRTYAVTLTAGRRYYIDLESGDFATYMRLLDPAGVIASFDEGGGATQNTRIVYQPVTTGTYQIVATSFIERSTGSFALTVREEE